MIKKRYFLTGGTGSFGKKFSNHLLKKFKNIELVIYSRDEMKQWEMQNQFKEYKNLKFIIGDIRDLSRLKWASKNSNYLVHAAATKIVPAAEYNPTECIKTNIDGANNVIEASISNKIEKVVALSTDKACNPVNLYGATKLVSDKLFVAANNTKEKTKFSIVRYGNVVGSRGSIIPFLISIPKSSPFPITDKRMTRFFINLDDAVNLVLFSFEDMNGGEIYVKKLYSSKVLDIAKAIDPKRKIEIIGIRPGEKLHEQMINEQDSFYTYEYKDYYKILSPINNMDKNSKTIKNGKKVKDNFIYSSELNSNWLNVFKLKKFIFKNFLNEN